MKHPESHRTPQVLIVGAGPTGLTLAIELARRGVTCRIIDRITSRSDKSRALVVHSRTLEFMRLMGVDDRFANAQRSSAVEAFILGRRIAGLEFGDSAAPDSRFPYIAFVSQAVTESILEDKLHTLGVNVEYGIELAGLAQDDDCAVATLRVAGGVEEVRCAYVVGCDGAHSRVRKDLELTFAGEAYPQSFVLADVKVDWSLSHDRLRVFLGRRGLLAFFPLDGAQASRLVLVRQPSKEENPSEPTLQEIQDLARQYTRRAVTVSNPRWLARFRLHHRGVGAYRLGRAFVAGDAAHIHSPVGGQGMNTGIHDAFNLGWKLAWVLNERLPAAEANMLLESYDAERRPVGRRLLQTTDRMFQVAATSNLVVATLRNFAIPFVLPLISASRAVRFRAFRFISELGIRYRRSTLNLTPWRDDQSRPQAGNRMPDFDRGGGHWLYDEFRHGGMTVVWVGCDAAGSHAGAPTVALTGASAKSRYDVEGRAVFVVRPDAHILLRLDDDAATPAGLTSAAAGASWWHTTT